MSEYSINNAGRTTQADALNTAFGGGTVEIRQGTSPGAGTAATGTLGVTITLPATPWTESNGVLTLSGDWSGVAVADLATGAKYARFKSSDESIVMDVSVTATGNGGLLIISNEIAEVDDDQIVDGNTVIVSACTITIPADNS